VTVHSLSAQLRRRRPPSPKTPQRAPNAGKVILRRLRFEARFARAIVDPPMPCEQIFEILDWDVLIL